MKRFFFIVLSGLLLLAGCQRDKPQLSPEGEAVNVSFRVGVAGAAKAIGDGTEALRLTLRIYDANHEFLQEYTADKAANESSWTITASLIPDVVYDFCFWASSPESDAYGFEGEYLTVDYSKISPNSDRDDAFWGVKSFKVEGAFTLDVTLQRPLALLALYSKDDSIDLGQEDLNDATKFVSALTLKGSIPTRLNLQSGVADQPQEEVTFAEAPLTALETDQTYGTALSYAYVLVPSGGLTLSAVDYSATLKRATPEKDLASGTAKDVPLEQNRRTLLVTGGGVQLGSVAITGWASQGAAIEGEAEEDPYNGLAYVDLGLSVKWATCNVGATKPEEPGDYFAWGETVQKTVAYTYSTLQYCTDDEGEKFSKYVPSGKSAYWDGAGSPDNKTVLDAEDDAATANWSGSWRMPTDAEFEELLALEKQWVENYNGSGINGYTFTGNGNTIFLPAAGYRYDTDLYYAGSDGSYWSSSLYTDIPGGAMYMYFSSGNVDRLSAYRCVGLSVRPVQEL